MNIKKLYFIAFFFFFLKQEMGKINKTQAFNGSN